MTRPQTAVILTPPNSLAATWPITDKDMDKDMFRKKFLFPLCYLVVVALAIVGANHMIPKHPMGAGLGGGAAMAGMEPAAGDATSDKLALTQTVAVPVPAIDESELKDAPVVTALPATDTPEEAPITISPDKPEIIHLNKDAVNVLVGSGVFVMDGVNVFVAVNVRVGKGVLVRVGGTAVLVADGTAVLVGVLVVVAVIVLVGKAVAV